MHSRKKPEKIVISEKIWKEIFHDTYENILRKLNAAKILIGDDAEMSAGLYTYAIEEFGKLLLLNQCIFQNGKCTIKYKDEFINHTYKIETAFDFLQENKSGQCISLNAGSFSPCGYSWRGFDIGYLVDFELRLSIFYCDFLFDDNKKVSGVVTPPMVEEDLLRTAIDELEKVVLQYYQTSDC
jgi:hypothetical protein